MEDWILLVIVIVIIYMFASGTYKTMLGAIGQSARPPNEVQNAAPIVTSADVSPEASIANAPLTGDAKKEMLEQRLINDGISSSNIESCASDLSFAKNNYGLPGIEFSEWAMYQTLDPRIVASNQQFVADRLGNPQTWTGATYSPDRHDTYDAVPWRGLYRPARVAVGSPDQIPDLDTSRNPITSKFKWDSSETE